MLTIGYALLFLSHSAQASLSLTDAFREAKGRSEDLASQIELVNQAEERYSQAIGAVLPSVNFVGSYFKQDKGSTSSVAPTEQKTYRISATQPLFRGFREYAALRQQSILSKAARFNRAHASTQLFMDTVQAYYQLLMLERDLSNLKTEIEVNGKRLKELNDFKRIGRSRASETLLLESNIASLEAQYEALKTSVVNARSVFRFITGVSNDFDLKDTESFPKTLGSLESFLQNVSSRPDILAADASAKASDEGVAIARGGHLPSLDFGGNYYFQRPGVVANVKWDLALTLTFPIFQGGIVSSEVAVAASVRKQADLALSKTERAAKEQIANFYELTQSDLLQLEKLKSTVDLTDKNYQAELRDYRLGLVNNLDVLQSLTASQETKRLYDRTEFQFKMDYLKLMSASLIDPRVKEEVKP